MLKKNSEMKEIPTKDKHFQFVGDIIEVYYTVFKLNAFYQTFLKKFIIDNRELCIQHHVPFQFVAKNTLRKNELVALFTPFFAFGELFRAMKKALPENFAQVLEDLIWQEGFMHTYIQTKYNIRVTENPGNKYEDYAELNPLFCIFQSKSDYRSRGWNVDYSQGQSRYNHMLYFDPKIQFFLRNYVDKPAEFNINPISDSQIPVDYLLYEDKNTIFSELPVLLAYFKQGQVKVSDSNGKPVASSINKMRKFCNIREFYEKTDEKELQSMRSHLLVETLIFLDDYNLLNEIEISSLIKKFYAKFKTKAFPLERLLPHIKGWQHVYYLNYDASFSVGTILEEMPLMEWVSVDNIIKSLYYRSMPLNIVDLGDASYYLYTDYQGTYGYKEKKYLNGQFHSEVLIKPLVKGILALFSSLGMVDILYKEPTNDFAKVLDKTYISRYDSLDYVRMTAFGAYVIGLNNNFTAPKVENDDVKLDETNLLIHYKGQNKSLVAMIETITRSAGPNLYKVDFETVLGKCNNQKEVNAQINTFKQLLDKNPPRIWKDFFEALQQKSYQLSSLNEEYKVFVLPDNKELISLIAKDEFLKKHIIRAEYFHVIIPNKHVNQVKKYLKKSGFLIEFD